MYIQNAILTGREHVQSPKRKELKAINIAIHRPKHIKATHKYGILEVPYL